MVVDLGVSSEPVDMWCKPTPSEEQIKASFMAQARDRRSSFGYFSEPMKMSAQLTRLAEVDPGYSTEPLEEGFVRQTSSEPGSRRSAPSTEAFVRQTSSEPGESTKAIDDSPRPRKAFKKRRQISSGSFASQSCGA